MPCARRTEKPAEVVSAACVYEALRQQNMCSGRRLTRAAAHVLRHDAAEVPEARLAAVALLAAHARLAGALAAGRVTRPLVGSVDVALAGTWG